MITILPYNAANYPAVVQLMAELQDYIASIDPLRRIRTLKDFDAKKYIDHLLRTIEYDQGIIFVAEEEEQFLGFIAGSIPREAEDPLDHYPVREGKIHELVVSEKYREKGIGRMLMGKLEEELCNQGCEYIRVGCFAPNTGTHAFYEKCGYGDRYVEMLKKLS